MSKKLIRKMISKNQTTLTEDDYNEGNLQALHDHIEKPAEEQSSTAYRLVVDHQGPTEVSVSKESQEKLAKLILG